jgi:hypothetical protein
MLFISAAALHQQSGSRTTRKMDLKVDLKALAVGGLQWTTLEDRRRKNHCGTTT